jgi:hypothetical protein
MPVSSEYIISCELLSLTSTAGRTSLVSLAYVIPCAIYSTPYSSVPRSKFGSCTALSSSFLHRNLSLWRSRVGGLRLHLCDWGAGMRHCTVLVSQATPFNLFRVQDWRVYMWLARLALCTHCIDDLLLHAPLPLALCSYWTSSLHDQIVIQKKL